MGLTPYRPRLLVVRVDEMPLYEDLRRQYGPDTQVILDLSTGGGEKDGDRILSGNDLTANGADH